MVRAVEPSATTLRYAKLLQQEHGFEVMPHLTCVGHTQDELLEILEEFAEAGFRNVMALRGDPPQREKPLLIQYRWTILRIRSCFFNPE